MLRADCQRAPSVLAIGCCRSGDVYSRQLCPAHLQESLHGTAHREFSCAVCGQRDLDIVTVIPLTAHRPATGRGPACRDRRPGQQRRQPAVGSVRWRTGPPATRPATHAGYHAAMHRPRRRRAHLGHPAAALPGRRGRRAPTPHPAPHPAAASWRTPAERDAYRRHVYASWGLTPPDSPAPVDSPHDSSDHRTDQEPAP